MPTWEGSGRKWDSAYRELHLADVVSGEDSRAVPNGPRPPVPILLGHGDHVPLVEGEVPRLIRRVAVQRHKLLYKHNTSFQ